MFDLSDKFNNTFEVLKYTIDSMKSVGYDQDSIYDYIEEATKNSNANLINVSLDYIDRCNNISNSYNDIENDLDSEYNNIINDDEIESYEGFEGVLPKWYWNC